MKLIEVLTNTLSPYQSSKNDLRQHSSRSSDGQASVKDMKLGILKLYAIFGCTISTTTTRVLWIRKC